MRVLETPAVDALHPEHQQRILDLANKVAQHRLSKGEQIESSRSSSELIRTLLQERKEECMSVLFLDARHRVIAFEEMFQGTINGAMVYTRVLIKRALEHNSSAIILAHNHPS